ncbi:MAG: hypothetical protein LBB16_03865 [Puniceicoccales bacterium]|nr:hypothetical protein [Puniceicoccales bacterium]
MCISIFIASITIWSAHMDMAIRKTAVLDEYLIVDVHIVQQDEYLIVDVHIVQQKAV